eukprot:3498442-Amphidinium_carterae.1
MFQPISSSVSSSSVPFQQMFAFACFSRQAELAILRAFWKMQFPANLVLKLVVHDALCAEQVVGGISSRACVSCKRMHMREGCWRWLGRS